MQSLYNLLGSKDNTAKEAALEVIADLAFTCETVSEQMCTPFLLATLMQLAEPSGNTTPQVQCAALIALGNLAFEQSNRHSQLGSEGLRPLLTRLASGNCKCI